ncbi:LysR substrate-binding domain-containing protein [Psychromonas sp.]|uniref:LysR substrate-binding domain-containing protein n=1 Tax=Psychromonas sp. TaxID=1884585 RepID=UPI003A9853F1
MSIKSRLIPPTGYLLVFESAARLGSLTKAADELCVTTTAVSKQVKNLENFLNIKLFTRSKQGVQLTAQGYQYLQRVREALDILSEETKVLEGASTAVTLNLEVGPCFMHFWLLPKIEQFRQAHPDIMLNITISNERYIDASDNYDVTFYYSTIATVNENCQQIFAERIQLVCSPKFLETHGGHIDLQSIFDQPLIMLKKEMPFWEGWKSWANKAGLTYRIPNNALMVDDQVAVIQAAINDTGIALVWDWHVSELIAKGELVSITDYMEFEEKAYFLHIAGKQNNVAANTFVGWVKQQKGGYRG